MTARIDLYQELGLPRTTATTEIDKRLARFIRDQLSAGKGGESLRSLETSRRILGNDQRRRVYDMRLDNKDSGPLDAQALYELAGMSAPSDSQKTPGATAPSAAQGGAETPVAGALTSDSQTTPPVPPLQAAQPAVPPTQPPQAPVPPAQESQPAQKWGFMPVGQAETNSFEEMPEATSVSARAQQLAASQRSANERYQTEQQRNQGSAQPVPPVQAPTPGQQLGKRPVSSGTPLTQIQPASAPQAPQRQPVAPVQAAQREQQGNAVQQGNAGRVFVPAQPLQPRQVVSSVQEPEVSVSERRSAFHRSPIVPAIMALYLLASILVRLLTVVEWTQGGETKVLRSLGVVTTLTGMERVDLTVPSLLVLAASVLLVVIGMAVYAMRRHVLGISLWVIAVVIDFFVGLVQAMKAMDWATGTVTDLGFGPYVLMVVALMGFVLAIGSALFSRR